MDLEANLLIERRNRYPRKYIGYPVFSRWTATDQDLFILRRFGTVSVRVALALQDKVTELEEQLNSLDDFYSTEESPRNVDNGSYRHEVFENRKRLIEEQLPAKLKDYYEFVDAYSRFASHPQPQQGALKTVQEWFRSTRASYIEGQNQYEVHGIDDQESAYIQCKEDLVCVHRKDKSPFRILIESTLVRLPLLKRAFIREIPERERIDPESFTTWQNDTNIDIFSWILFALLTLGMLTGPLWILEKVNSMAQQLGIITGFIGVFFILVALATTAKVSEAIGAAAAYAAVLMVFLTLGTSK